MTRSIFSAILLLTCGLASKAVADTEYIVVSGGPAVRKFEDLRRPGEQHDRWWGNFIRPARMRIEEMEGTSYMAYYPHL